MSFPLALRIVLKNEGGKVDNPHDPGGRTNKGITNRVYRAWKKDPTADVFNATDQEITDIYEAWYWKLAGCPFMAEPLATVAFDTAVNVGVAEFLKLYERAKEETGPGLAFFLLNQRQAFYAHLVAQEPVLNEFLSGWTKRVNRLRLYCEDTAAQAGGYLPVLKAA